MKKSLLLSVAASSLFAFSNANAVDVSTFSQLQTALRTTSTELDPINITSSFTWSSEITVGLDSYINGNKNTLNGNRKQGFKVSAGKELTLNNVTANNFYTTGDGGFIFNDGTINVENSTFINNQAVNAGGVFRNNGPNSGALPQDTFINITNSVFANNTGGQYGSAIMSNSDVATITKSEFSNNMSGVIGSLGILYVYGSDFLNNAGSTNMLSTHSGAREGAALRNHTSGMLYINHSDDPDQAIDESLITTFTSNNAEYGGAIFNSVRSSTGPVIAYIRNATFTDNSASITGGAIYNKATLNLLGGSQDVTFSGNTDGTGSNAIYNDTIGVVNFDSNNDGSIISSDIFSGAGQYNLISGTLVLKTGSGFAANTPLAISDGAMLSTIDDAINTTNLGNATLNGNITYGIDVNLSSATTDKIEADNFSAGANTITLTDINVIADTDSSTPIVKVLLSDDNAIKSAIRLGTETFSGTTETYDATAYEYRNTEADFGKLTIFNISTLAAMVAYNAPVKTYNLSANETVLQDLGALQGGDTAQLTINTSGAYAINGNGNLGMSTTENQIVTINDVARIYGFDGNFIDNSGTLNLNATTRNLAFQDSINMSNTGILNIKTQTGFETTFSDAITGSGTIDISQAGTNTFSGAINATNLNISNGTNTFNNTLTSGLNVSGGTNTLNAAYSGAINLSGGVLKLGTQADNESAITSFTGSGGLLDLRNGEYQTTNLNDITLNATTDVGIDVSLSGANPQSDIINIDSKSGNSSSTLNISDITVSNNPDINVTTSIQVATGDTTAVSIDSENVNVSYSSTPEDNFLISYNNTTGYLNFDYSSLNKAVASAVTQKVYAMATSQSATASLGAMGGESLTITGSAANVNILGANFAGLSVDNANQELVIKDINQISGFSGNFITANTGSVELYAQNYNMTLENGIANNATLLLKANDTLTMSINAAITGTGTLTLSGDGAINLSTVQSGNLNVQSNATTFNGAVQAVDINLNGTQATFKNALTASGEVDINTGSTSFEGTLNAQDLIVGTSAGTTSFANNVVVKKSDASSSYNGTITLRQEATFDGSVEANNIILSGDGTTQIDGTVSATDAININVGTTNFNNTVIANEITIAAGATQTTFDNIVTTTDNIKINSNTTFNNTISTNIFDLNSGIINLSNTLTATDLDISGGSLIIGQNASISNGADLTASGGFIDFGNSTMQATEFKDINISSNTDISIDVDLSTSQADSFSSTGTQNGGGVLNITELNILNDAISIPQTSITIAIGNMKDYVDLSDTATIIDPAGGEVYTKENYLIEYDATGANGVLTFAYNNLSYAITSAVETKVYNMNNAEGITSALTLGGDKLTINANNTNLTASGSGSITTTSTQELNINDVNQLNIPITNGGALNITDASNITGTITNTGTVSFVSTTNQMTVGTVSGTGDINISGAGSFDFNSAVAGNQIEQTNTSSVFANGLDVTTFDLSGGEATFNNATIDNLNLSNSATADLNGALSGTINFDNGTINLATGTIADNSNIVVKSGGGTLNIAGNDTYTTTNLDSITLDGNLNYDIDISLSEPKSDILNAVSADGSGRIILDEINITTNAQEITEDGIDVTIANAIAGAKIDITSATTINNLTNTTEDYDGYSLSYNNAGVLNFNYNSLASSIESIVAQKAYKIGTTDASITEALVMGGDVMTIDGNTKNITGSGSININQTSQELTIKNTNEFGVDITNNAETSFEDIQLISADINNSKNINITGNAQTTISGEITGTSGTINVDNNATFNNTISGNTLNITDNTTILNGEFSSGTIKLGNATLELKDSATIGASTNLTTTGGGRIDILDNAYNTYDFNIINLSGNTNLGLDINLATKDSDKINGSYQGSGKLVINDLNILADATNMPSTGLDINISNQDLLEIAQGASLNITKPAGSTEDYNSGYLISANNGSLNFKYSSLQSAIESSVTSKAFAMGSNATIDASGAILNGSSLTIDGSGYTISGGAIDLNANTLSITDATINSEININSGTLSFFDKTIINSELTGAGIINLDENVTINSDVSSFSGTTNLNGGTVSLGAGATFFDGNLNISNTPTLNLNNGVIDTINASNWSFNSNLNTTINVDLISETADGFVGTSTAISGQPSINITGIYVIDGKDKEGVSTVSLTNRTGAGNITLDSNAKAYSNLYKYQINSDLLNTNGTISFASDGYEFNSAVLESIIANQSNYLSNVNIYKEAFANFGTNGFAQKGFSSGDAPSKVDSIWFRPFGRTEDVNLDDGTTIDNQSYGAIFGIDSKTHFYDNCWNGIYSLYAGYTGSRQKYEDSTINQNGLVIGARALFQNNNAFTGLTANIGSSFANGKNMFGSEEFLMLSAGIASKTGYNFSFKDDKYIIQPSMLFSYTYINTPGYTSTSDAKISTQNLNAFQITPEIKLIANVNKHTQAYTGAAYNWNIINASEVTANDIALPNITVDPYTEYKVGLTRKFEDEIESFAEITATTGGREGFGLELGVKWNF